jgi:hypothetical protein
MATVPCGRPVPDRPAPAHRRRAGFVLRAGPWIVLFAALSGVALGALAAEETEGPRFDLEAELRPLAVSACGRFALDAQARLAPEAKSANGRFTLKAVHVPAGGCNPFPDPLFADGFENP